MGSLAWPLTSEHRRNWPVVYVLDSGDAANGASVYVGEAVNAASRMRQHLASPAKAGFRSVRVVIDETFNKSACLDLESHLIRWLAGDGAFTVMNGNEGIIDAQYYERDLYREGFAEVFEQLRAGDLPAQHPRDREQRPLQAVAVQGAHAGTGDRRRRHRRWTARGPRDRRRVGERHRRAPRNGQDDRRDLPDEAARRCGAGRDAVRGRRVGRAVGRADRRRDAPPEPAREPVVGHQQEAVHGDQRAALRRRRPLEVAARLDPRPQRTPDLPAGCRADGAPC